MKMSEKARAFAEHYEMYCVGDEKIVQVGYSAVSQSWDHAIDTILRWMADDVEQHKARTGDGLEVIRQKIEAKLCAAAEEENDQPTIFPM